MEWINAPRRREMGGVVLGRVARLRGQMSRAGEEKQGKADGD